MSTNSESTSATQGSLAYWIFNYRPEWEAASKEVALLSSQMQPSHDVRLYTLNRKQRWPQNRDGELRLPLAMGLASLPLLMQGAKRFGVNHLFASPTERFVTPRVSRLPAILTVTKDSPSLAKFEQNLEHLRNFRYVVVESQRHRELLLQGGLEPDRIKLIYPGVDVMPYTPADGPLTLLFATSPFSAHDFLSRGILLMLRAAERLPHVRWLLVWRKAQYQRICDLVDRAGLTNVEVRNGYIPDMADVFRQVHATILPGLESQSLKPCPHSALESLAFGKPVLVSQPTSIACEIATGECGVVFEPTVEGLVRAVQELQQGYAQYQAKCHAVVTRTFSRQVFLDRYRALYDTLLA